MEKILCFFIFLLIGCKSTQELSPAYSSHIEKHREEYKEDFNKDDYSPIKGDDLEYMQFYPPTKAFYKIAIFQRVNQKASIEIPTYSGKQKEFYVYGNLTFEHKNKVYKLAIYRSLYTMKIPEYENHLFIPFKDLTNGDETYGGGRYIDIMIPDIVDDKVVLDFNKAYNPYCAYSDGYNCPIPPVENHLDIAILAGEKMYTGPRRNRIEP